MKRRVQKKRGARELRLIRRILRRQLDRHYRWSLAAKLGFRWPEGIAAYFIAA